MGRDSIDCVGLRGARAGVTQNERRKDLRVPQADGRLAGIVIKRAGRIGFLALMGCVGCATVLFLINLVSDTKIIKKSGPYLVERKGDGMFGMLCQPRQEFYLVDDAAASKTYLGTCGTPAFLGEEMHLAGDQSCFAISEDQSSMVYFHRPRLCGGGPKAAAKRGGVYVHTKTGDHLLYDDSQVAQMWGGSKLASPGIRVSWISPVPHEGMSSSQSVLIISPTGAESTETRAQ